MGPCLTKADDKNGKKNVQLPEGTTLKILLVGDSTVGKTSIICRFADGIFNETQEQSIEVDFPSKLKEIEVDGSKLNYKFGIQLDKKNLEQSLLHIIEEHMV